MAKHNETGVLGEAIAQKLLISKNFKIIELNYWKKWGEIDIIAEKVTRGTLITHFIEVKSTLRAPDTDVDAYNPIDHVHNKKIKRLKRVIQTYILDRKTKEWQFDVIVVYINEKDKIAQCKYHDDIIL